MNTFTLLTPVSCAMLTWVVILPMGAAIYRLWSETDHILDGPFKLKKDVFPKSYDCQEVCGGEGTLLICTMCRRPQSATTTAGNNCRGCSRCNERDSRMIGELWWQCIRHKWEKSPCRIKLLLGNKLLRSNIIIAMLVVSMALEYTPPSTLILFVAVALS
jgi:hypothetical protein